MQIHSGTGIKHLLHTFFSFNLKLLIQKHAKRKKTDEVFRSHDNHTSNS